MTTHSTDAVITWKHPDQPVAVVQHAHVQLACPDGKGTFQQNCLQAEGPDTWPMLVAFGQKLEMVPARAPP